MKVKLLKVRILQKPSGDLAYLKKNIRDHGVLFPILIDQDMVVQDGRRRVLAALELGHSEIEAVIVKGENEMQNTFCEQEGNVR